MKPSRRALARRRPLRVQVVREPDKRAGRLFVVDRAWWQLVTSQLAAGTVLALVAGVIAAVAHFVTWQTVVMIATGAVLLFGLTLFCGWLIRAAGRWQTGRSQPVQYLISVGSTFLLLIIATAVGTGAALIYALLRNRWP